MSSAPNPGPTRLAPLSMIAEEWLSTSLRARGLIADQPVADLILQHIERGSGGTLRLQRGKVRKDIFFNQGRPIGSASNIRHEALGSMLVAQGILDESQLAFLLSESRRIGRKMGETLIALGWMSPEDVLSFLAAQSRRRLAEALRWRDGEFEFSPDQDFLPEVIEHPEDVPRLVFTALRKTSAPDTVLGFLNEQHAGDRLVPTPRFAKYRAAFTGVFAGAAPAPLDWLPDGVNPAMRNLLGRPDAAQIALGVEALRLTGLATFAPARVDTPSASPRIAFDPFSLEHLSDTPAAAGSSGPTEGSAAFDLFAPVPVPVKEAEASPMEEFADIPSGVIALDSRISRGRAGSPTTSTTGEATDPGAAIPSAETLFSRGRELLANGQAHDAIAPLEQATQLSPDDPVYHANLAAALLDVSGTADALRARQHAERAVALDPGYASAYEILGRAAAVAGQNHDAIAAFEHALTLDPEGLPAAQQILELLSRAGAHGEAETACRRWLSALGQRAPAMRRVLWQQLARLYETRLNNPPAALMAYDVAARLAPDDLALQAKVVELSAHDLADWKENARALSAQWRAAPDNADVARTLRDLYLRIGKRDGAAIVATAMSLRGIADPSDDELVERHRVRELSPLLRPLDENCFTLLRHPQENAALESLFGALANAGILPGATEDPGGARTVLTAAQQPEPFRRVFLYLCRAFGWKDPPWLLRATERVLAASLVRPDAAAVVDADPLTLAVRSDLLASSDTLAIAFHLARAFSLAAPGRGAAAARSGRSLRPYLLATLGLPGKPAAPGVAQPSIDEVRAIEARLAACAPELRAALRTRARALVAAQPTLDLSAWSRALRGTADRTGLLISRDLDSSVRITLDQTGRDAAEALVEFALSPEHILLRGETGFVTVNAVQPSAGATERREQTRVDLEVEIGMLSDHNFYTGILQDISEGGIFVATHQVRPVGERLIINLRLPDEKENIAVQTEVRWVREPKQAREADGQAAGMGLRFVDPDPRVVELSNRFMRQRESLLYETD